IRYGAHLRKTTLQSWVAQFRVNEHSRKGYYDKLKGDVIKALQVLKCALRQDLLFRSPAPSSSFEQEVEDTSESDNVEVVDGFDEIVEKEGDTGVSAWDLILDDKDDD
ncbi:hypothetical protein A0H81_14999, partial [Grifola frondosa]